MGRNSSDYDKKYREQNIKRIPLDVKKEKYEEIKSAADEAGEPVNTFIKKAIDERLDELRAQRTK